MKYNILGFQQKELMNLGLNVDDALLLRLIKDMYSSSSMEFIIHENKSYMWVNQGYLLNQIPIIGSRSTLNRKLDNLNEKGLLDKLLLHKRKGQKGNFYYVRPTLILDHLQDYDPYVKMTTPLCQNDITLMSKRHNKDTSIRDTSIRDNNTLSTTLTKEKKEMIIKKWNELELSQVRSLNENTDRYKSLKARIDDYSYEELLEAISQIDNSTFLKGGNDRKWQATLDWLVKPNNFLKVLEGNYRDMEVITNENSNNGCSKGNKKNSDESDEEYFALYGEL